MVPDRPRRNPSRRKRGTADSEDLRSQSIRGTEGGALTGRVQMFDQFPYDASEMKTQIELPGIEAGPSPALRQLDEVLRAIREVLHRRGRLSSRKEALDEVSKLLFAHVIARRNGEQGIARESLRPYGLDRKGSAAALSEFVVDLFARNLPASLVSEIKPRDFALRIKPSETQLADELIELFELMSSQEETLGARFHEFDILNEVFGKFLTDSFIDEKELGQYLTPPEVVRFMVRLAIHDMDSDDITRLVNPEQCGQFGLVLDPSCGVGSFLVELLRVLRPAVEAGSDEDALSEWLSRMGQDVLVGVDKSERMIHLALANMALLGAPKARLHLSDALDRSHHRIGDSLEGKARLILTNPPFGAEHRGNDLRRFRLASVWSSRAPAKIDSELLFMERYLDWLAPGGQLVAIVPDSVLTNRGLFSVLRTNLAQHIEIRAVVSLPAVTFGSAGTSTKTSVLYLRKRPNGPRGVRTFASVCRDIGYEIVTRGSQRMKVRTGEGDLPPILEAFRGGSPGPVPFRVVEDISASERWDAGYHVGFSESLVQALRDDKRRIAVKDVAELSNERVNPAIGRGSSFRYIEISDVDMSGFAVGSKLIPRENAPSRARKPVQQGDVLVSTVRPERKAVGVVLADNDGAVCTTGFAVLRPRSISPLLLAALLRSNFVTEQLMRNNIGIAYPAIDENCILDVVLPIDEPGALKLSESASSLEQLEQKLMSSRREFKTQVQQMADSSGGESG